MKKIKPITVLRDTLKLSQEVNFDHEPILITKNGYADMVVMSYSAYEEMQERPLKNGSTKKSLVIPEKFLEPALQTDPLGFVKVMAASINLSIGGIKHNLAEIKRKIDEAVNLKAKILVFQELTLTGFTAGDMFFNDLIIKNSLLAIQEIVEFSQKKDVFISFGAPLRKEQRLYNCAIQVYRGKILGVTPKKYILGQQEIDENRYFKKASDFNDSIDINGAYYPFGNKIIYINSSYRKLQIGLEIGDDLWAVNPPSTFLALNGATVILNLSASNEVVGKKEYREDLVKTTSGRLMCGYIYANASCDESTTDLVFGSQHLIAENGKILAQSELFQNSDVTYDLDLEKILAERIKRASNFDKQDIDTLRIYFDMPLEIPENLERFYPQNPFIPEKEGIDLALVNRILLTQAMGLVKRLKTTKQTQVLVGLSGGLDSTLALIVAVEAFKKLDYDLKGIHAITLPAFGTSQRTYNNAIKLTQLLKTSFKEINIKETLLSHFKDLNLDPENTNITFENAQARERTQVLMDLGNEINALMIGTGDLSELVLGWTTYNGDHMSMYGVNASIPKTLVKYLCLGYAQNYPELQEVLKDIVSTPISPELLPVNDLGLTSQITEEVLGPYEVQDFFIYHFLRFGYRPKKLFYIAQNTFQNTYSKNDLKKWLRIFFERFYRNQFKRSASPDGPKVGTVSISPRLDLKLPSDASNEDYLDEINNL